MTTLKRKLIIIHRHEILNKFVRIWEDVNGSVEEAIKGN